MTEAKLGQRGALHLIKAGDGVANLEVEVFCSTRLDRQIPMHTIRTLFLVLTSLG